MPLNPGDVALRIPERLIVTLSSVFEDDTVAVRCLVAVLSCIIAHVRPRACCLPLADSSLTLLE